MSKLISDDSQVEISNKGMGILRMYHSSSWHAEPYIKPRTHQNGFIEPSKHGPTPSLTCLEHLPIVGCFA